MMQATNSARDRAEVLIAELATSPDTAALLTAIVDFMADARRRGAAHAGTSQLLVMLSKSGPCCGADLAASLHLDQSTVSRHISALESDGLVQRSPSAHDRRVLELELTEAGRLAARQEFERRIRLLESAVTDWSADDIDTLTRLLTRFSAGLRSTSEGTSRHE